MKKKIGILTATRAEFGLLRPLIIRMIEDNYFKIKVLVTGAHLCPEFGNTYKEIEAAGINIDKKIECVTKGDEPFDISKNMALAIERFGEYFKYNKLDLLIVLGDRYETLAVCIAAMNEEIPIAHIHGGESTQGAIDEAIRHSITKMSHIHFATTEKYRNRIIQLGEQPCYVFNVGALGVENAKNINLMKKVELEENLGIKLKSKFAVVTFHPVTLEEDCGINQFEELLGALQELKNMSFIITKSNADAGGRKINKYIDDFAQKNNNVVAVTSLGTERYLSAINECDVVIGNSSSGIIEAPVFHTPTVNIGNRQRGRLMPKTVLSCQPYKEEIVATIKKAISDEFQNECKYIDNPFGEGNTSENIIRILKDIFNKQGQINIDKVFYDLKTKS
ncbi:MAG: UDP-N-acetylglucosamine 2-epimerase (hydrolyzing) [Lachnospiraceae bacterium]|nr:UDP-N-acetylglucosamine 2-epimerase (hydrolyzing) [Lachnospiraceae bacterium]